MKILIHQNSQVPLRVISNTQEDIILESGTCPGALWELAMRYPNEIIGWCEADFVEELALNNWEKIFPHDMILASYAIKTIYMPDSIGYVDLLPFVNVNRRVKYPTWLMSSDIGGIKGDVLLRFKDISGKVENLGYLLNSVAKIGQQNGLLCYSDPALNQTRENVKAVPQASSDDLFSFVYQHYSSWWTSVLFYCMQKFEKKYLVDAYAKAFLRGKKFQCEVDLSGFEPYSIPNVNVNSIDVIIPTLARKEYLRQVLEDLKLQTLHPKNVIIIEQDPEAGSRSHLGDILSGHWPFKIIHLFTHQIGVCNARNLGLDKVDNEWIFFADDDIRFASDLLERVMVEVSRYRISALNLNCTQPGEETIFNKMKQWGSFGGGTSVVRASYAKRCRFSAVFEEGFGEDSDFGMQLRNLGCDIIYHPAIKTLHLKAPTGGFRKKTKPWEKQEISPKPSPTLMAYALRNYTKEQINGYKVSLFLKFYSKQSVRNPIRYLSQMRKRWALSEKWAEQLLIENKNI